MHTNPFVFEVALFVLRIAFLLVLVHLTRRSTLPYPAAMAIAGLAGSVLPGALVSEMDPDIILFVILPPLLYFAAWFTSWPEFKRNARAVFFLAFGLVFVTTVSVAVVIKLFCSSMPWAVAFVLGACVSPPDAIAATVVCRKAKVSPRLLAVLEGESLINDASALVALRIALAAALSGASSVSDFASQLVIATFGGIGVGLVIGKVGALLHRVVIEDTFVALGLSLLIPYTAYAGAEYLHASGVLAVVTAGILISRESPVVLSPASRIVGASVWGMLTLMLNAFAFTLIGLQAHFVTLSTDSGSGLEFAAGAVAVLATVVLTRFGFIVLTARLATGHGFFERDGEVTLRHHLVVGWTGMRGAVSLAAVLSIPFTLGDGTPFPFREELIAITLFVVVATLVGGSATLPWLIRRLRLESGDELAAQDALVCKELVEAAGSGYRRIENECHITAELTEAALAPCRERLQTLRLRGDIGEEVFRKNEYLLDLREMSLKETPLEGE